MTERIMAVYFKTVVAMTIVFAAVVVADGVIGHTAATFDIAYDEAALTLAALATAVAVAMQDRIVRWICRHIP